MKFHSSRLGQTVAIMVVSVALGACGEKPEAMLASAKSYLAKSDTKAAVIQLKNALQAKPDLPEARFLLGSALLDSGDAAGAEIELRKALELRHPQDAVVPQLAKALLAQRESKKLIDEWANAELGESSARASLQMSLTSAYAMLGKTDLAQGALASALSAEPGFAPALLAQARQKAGGGDVDGALSATADVIAKNPQDHEAWKLKADLLLYGKNQVELAMAAYRKAIEIKPDFMAAHTAIIASLLQQGQLEDAQRQLDQLKKHAANHPQTKYLEAQLAFQKHDFKLARDLIQQVLKAVPANVQALQLAGLVEFQLNSLLQAESFLSKALQAAPGLPLARRALVMTYLRSGQPNRAMEVLLPGLEAKNVDPALLPVAGEVFLQNGDIKKAEEYFSKATQQSPKNVRSGTSLALTHLVGGQVDQAFDELRTLAGSDAGVTADLALISAHLKRQEFDKALKAVDGLEKKQPDKPLAAQLRASTLLAKRDMDGARKSFERALAITPNYFPAVAGLASLDMADKKPEAAKKRFEAVLASDPKSVQALLALAQLAVQTGAPRDEIAKLLGNAVAASPTNLTPRLMLIDFHLRGNEVKQANSVAQNGVTAFPDSAEMLDALGRTQLAANEPNQAIASYNKLAVMQPHSPQAHMRLAEIYATQKNVESAVSNLRKALDIKPDLLVAQRALIALEINQENFTQALVVARTVQKQRPKETAGYALEGDIHVTQKNWKDAESSYRAGLKQANATELAIKIHSVFLASGRGAEADKFSSAWQKDNPKDAAFVFYLGDGALARKDYAAAEKVYQALIKLQDKNAVAYNNLAWVTAKLNKPGAVAYAEKANALAPDQPAFMDTLAVLLAERGDYAKAVEIQSKALSMQPDNPIFKLNLAKIHIKGGNKDLARKQLEVLSALGDKYRGQGEVAELLKSL